MAARRFTGDLVLSQAGRSYKICWEDGQVTAADSPAPGDQPVRVALGAGLIDTTTVNSVLNALSQSPRRDQMELIAELGRLTPEQIVWLKRRSLGVRAARQFSLADATYSINNARSMVAEPGVPPIDARWLIYHGVVTHYTQERLEREAAPLLGKAFTIAQDALATLPAFGFADLERACIQRLQGQPATLPDLAADLPSMDRRRLLAIVYTLVACDCLALSDAPGPARSTRPSSPPASAPASAQRLAHGTLRVSPIPAPAPPAGSGPIPRSTGSVTEPPAPPRARPSPTREPFRPSSQGKKAAQAFKLPSTKKDGEAIGADEVRHLVHAKLADADRGVDHFALLGLSQTPTSAQIHEAYFHLAKRLHPDRLRAVGALDIEADAQRLFARINTAFATLTNARKLSDYRRTLAQGGEEAIRKKQAEAEALAARIFEAEDHFRAGEAMLRRSAWAAAVDEFQKAVDLNPEEGEHHAYLAWALWCSATDKSTVGGRIHALLEEAARKSPNSAAVSLYKGLIAKHRGDLKAAKAALKRALEIEPSNIIAQSELRVMSAQEDGDNKGGGLFGRKRK